jgi:hypothetical protein
VASPVTFGLLILIIQPSGYPIVSEWWKLQTLRRNLLYCFRFERGIIYLWKIVNPCHFNNMRYPEGCTEKVCTLFQCEECISSSSYVILSTNITLKNINSMVQSFWLTYNIPWLIRTEIQFPFIHMPNVGLPPLHPSACRVMNSIDPSHYTVDVFVLIIPSACRIVLTNSRKNSRKVAGMRTTHVT